MRTTCFLPWIRLALMMALGNFSMACVNAGGGDALGSTYLGLAPAGVVDIAAGMVDSAHKESLKFLGPRALRVNPADRPPYIWLVPLQEASGEYCTFIEVDQEKRASRELATFVGCRIVREKFSDLDGDGAPDGLYTLQIKSNRYDAVVEEEVLFLRDKGGSRFCRSAETPKFGRDGTAFRCAQ